MEDMTPWSLSDDTNVIANPFVPNRPARLLAHKDEVHNRNKTLTQRDASNYQHQEDSHS